MTRRSLTRRRAFGLDHEVKAGSIVVFNSRRRLWAVIRAGVTIAEAPTRAEAELIADPESLFSAQSKSKGT